MFRRNASILATVTSIIAGTTASAASAADKDVYGYQGISLTRVTAPDACQSLGIKQLSSGGCYDTSTRWKIFGGYRFHRNFGLEVSYADLGRAQIEGRYLGMNATGKVKASGLGLSAVGYLPMGDELAFFAKAGAVRWRTKTNHSVAGAGSVENSESGVGIAGGVGLSYFFNQDIGVRVEYEVIEGVGDKGDNLGSDVHMMSVGVMLRF